MSGIKRCAPFNTPEADAVRSALEVFPPDNPWNTPVEHWPVAANSKAMIAPIGPDKPLRYNPDMSFVLVPPDQKKVDGKLTVYSGESDPGSDPVPKIAVIESRPAHFKRGDGALRGLTLEDVQRGKRALMPIGAEWSSIFDLSSNKLRPDGWTSSDAAGFPIVPFIVRYDELKRGKIDHALRGTFRHTRRAYVYPATHYASRKTDPNLPRMGERFRLRRDDDSRRFPRR